MSNQDLQYKNTDTIFTHCKAVLELLLYHRGRASGSPLLSHTRGNVFSASSVQVINSSVMNGLSISWTLLFCPYFDTYFFVD